MKIFILILNLLVIFPKSKPHKLYQTLVVIRKYNDKHYTKIRGLWIRNGVIIFYLTL